jgi:metal-responsive CopG/Arc/MetJ family transcriptional regulator
MSEKDRRYVNVLFDEQTLAQLDDLRFRARFPSRTEAIRWLVAYGLKRLPKIEQIQKEHGSIPNGR